MSGISEKIKSVIAEQLGVKSDEVTDQAKFVDDLGADSLDTVELVMALEEEYGVEIPDEDAEKLTTVGEAIKYIEEKIAYARQFYNDTVMKFNVKQQVFPSSIIAKMFNFKEKEYFEIEAPEAREPVKVEF